MDGAEETSTQALLLAQMEKGARPTDVFRTLFTSCHALVTLFHDERCSMVLSVCVCV